MRGVAPVRTRAFSLCALVAAVALAGCAAPASNGSKVSSGALSIWASQPPNGDGGQSAADVLDAEQLAYAQLGAKVGKFTIDFKIARGTEISANAREAIQDTSSIAYLGEIPPGTSQDSVPINNELGLLEFSPTDTASYLTIATPAVKGSPGTFYPSSSTYHETFARVVPTTVQEAKALVSAMSAAHVSKLYVADDGSNYGATIALEVRNAASAAGLTVVSSASGADAIFYGAVDNRGVATELGRQADSAPSAKVFVPSALYDDSVVTALPAAVQGRLYASSPGFLPSAMSAGAQKFESAFTARFGHAPAPEAIFGYEVVRALYAALQKLAPSGISRAAVVTAVRGLQNQDSPLIGTYSLSGGDTNIAPFVIARVHAGKLVPSTSP